MVSPLLEPGQKILVASHNPGKVREIGELLEPLGLTAISAGELDLPEPEENGATFNENALIKSRAARDASGLAALADDSGLCVTALKGDPGIYSARWAGPNKDFSIAMQKVEEALEGKSDRSAYFHCSLALSLPNGQDHVFEGQVHGSLVWPPRGERGFGYDPVFLAKGMEQTFGEIDPQAKHAMSHRAAAFAKLLAFLKEGV